MNKVLQALNSRGDGRPIEENMFSAYFGDRFQKDYAKNTIFYFSCVQLQTLRISSEPSPPI